jgi:hypothetical protein
MKQLITALIILLFNIDGYTKTDNDLIRASLFFVQTQHGYSSESKLDRGIIISIINHTNKPFFIEDGLLLNQYLEFKKNNLAVDTKELIKKQPITNVIEESESVNLGYIMIHGNGFNNLFSKPDNLLIDYASNLIYNSMTNGKNLASARQKSLFILYLDPYSCHSIYIDLNNYNLTSEYTVRLNFNNNRIIEKSDKSITMPKKIKEYQKYDGEIVSDILSIRMNQ